MRKLLFKYKFIRILPFDDAFYYSTYVPKNVKFTKALIELNYLKYSPFKNPFIVDCIQNDNVMLWYSKNKIEAPFIVPESYFLFMELKKQKKNAIYILKDTILKTLVIKDSKLLSAFVLDTIDENILDLSLEEYQVKETIYLDKMEYTKLYQDAQKNLSFQDMFKFRQFDFEIKSIFKKTFEYLAYPIAGLIMFAIILNFIHGKMLHKDLNKLQKNYTTIKSHNQKTLKAINEHNQKIHLWQDFIDKELIYPDSKQILDLVYTIFKTKENVSLVSLSASNGKMTLMLKTNMNPVIFLNRLSKISYFHRVIIAQTYKSPNSLPVVVYNIDINTLRSQH